MENDVSRAKEPLFFVVRSPGIFQSLTQPARHELGRGVEHRGDGETSVPHVRSRDRHPERPFVPQRLRTVSRFIRTAFMSVGGEPWYGVLSRLRKKENKKGTSCDIPAFDCPIKGLCGCVATRSSHSFRLPGSLEPKNGLPTATVVVLLRPRENHRNHNEEYCTTLKKFCVGKRRKIFQNHM